MMKVYAVYLDDGENVYKEWIPAVSEKEARDYCKGNGEIVAVKETTGFSFNTEKLGTILSEAGYDDKAVDLLTRLVNICGLGA